MAAGSGDGYETTKKANGGNENKQTLSTLLQNRNDDATECLAMFVERSLTTETPKAMAVHAFINAYEC